MLCYDASITSIRAIVKAVQRLARTVEVVKRLKSFILNNLGAGSMEQNMRLYI